MRVSVCLFLRICFVIQQSMAIPEPDHCPDRRTLRVKRLNKSVVTSVVLDRTSVSDTTGHGCDDCC